MIPDIHFEELTKELITELIPLVLENHAESGYTDQCDVNWENYLKAGFNMFPFVMRKEGEIVGLMLVYGGPYPHDINVMYAEQMTYYIKPRYRRYSHGMMSYAEAYMKEIGCEYFVQIARVDTPFNRTLTRRGYEPLDVKYGMRL